MNVIKTKNVIRLFIYCIISRRIFYSLWNRKEIDTSTCEMSLYKQEMIMVIASPSFQTDVTMTGTVTLHCFPPLSPFSDFPAHATTNPPVLLSSPCFCRYFHPCHLLLSFSSLFSSLPSSIISLSFSSSSSSFSSS